MAVEGPLIRMLVKAVGWSSIYMLELWYKRIYLSWIATLQHLEGR
jgi:hypothetical protein